MPSWRPPCHAACSLTESRSQKNHGTDDKSREQRARVESHGHPVKYTAEHATVICSSGAFKCQREERLFTIFQTFLYGELKRVLPIGKYPIDKSVTWHIIIERFNQFSWGHLNETHFHYRSNYQFELEMDTFTTKTITLIA